VAPLPALKEATGPALPVRLGFGSLVFISALPFERGEGLALF
jgi:hypothetical protein